MERWQETLVVTVSSKSKRLLEAGTLALNWILSMQIYEIIKQGCSINIAAAYFQEFVEFCQETLKLNKGNGSAELVIYAEGTICSNQLTLVLTENEVSGRLVLKLKTDASSWLVLEEDELMLLAGCSPQATGIVLNERLGSARTTQPAPVVYAPVTQPVSPPPAVTVTPLMPEQKRTSSEFSFSPRFLNTPSPLLEAATQQPPVPQQQAGRNATGKLASYSRMQEEMAKMHPIRPPPARKAHEPKLTAAQKRKYEPSPRKTTAAAEPPAIRSKPTTNPSDILPGLVTQFGIQGDPIGLLS